MIDDREHKAFAERIGKSLRTTERAGVGFADRTMSAVFAAALETTASAARRSWWTRERTFRATPAGLLAMAASVVAIVLAGSNLVSALEDGDVQRSAVVSQHQDTVHVVRFVLVNRGADRVALVGAFNRWDKSATALTQADGSGIWTVDVPLAPGRHEYAFVVHDEEGDHWLADPVSPSVHDEFGTETSVISVGSSAS